MQRTEKFFKNHFNKKLSMHDRFEFLDFWYIIIIINDILTIVGSAYKIETENGVGIIKLAGGCDARFENSC